MRKTILIFICINITNVLFAQQISTLTANDWNVLRHSGFYESSTSDCINTPNKIYDYFWGINIAHTANKSVLTKPYHWGGQIAFGINRTNSSPAMYIRSTTEIGEGQWAKVLHSEGDHAINGKLTTKEIEIKINTGADFVFKPNYNLMSLSEVESYVKVNRHLPDIPSEKEMQENGLNLNDM